MGEINMNVYKTQYQNICNYRTLIKLKIIFFIFFPVLSHSISCDKHIEQLSEFITRGDLFRKAFNKGDVMEGNNIYISYMKKNTGPGHSLFFGKIVDVSKDIIFVENNVDAYVHELKEGSKDFETIEISSSSKWYFESIDQLNEGLKNNKIPEGDGKYISYNEYHSITRKTCEV